MLVGVAASADELRCRSVLRQRQETDDCEANRIPADVPSAEPPDPRQLAAYFALMDVSRLLQHAVE